MAVGGRIDMGEYTDKPTIIIDGPAGSGKTIITQYIAKETGFQAIHMDKGFKQAVTAKRREVRNLFGRGRRSNETVKQYLDTELFARPNAEMMLKFLDEIRDELEGYCQKQKKKNALGYAIEGITSCMFKEEWEGATIRCVILALLEQIYGNVDGRGRSDDTREIAKQKFIGIAPFIMTNATNVNVPIICHGNRRIFLRKADPMIDEVLAMMNQK